MFFVIYIDIWQLDELGNFKGKPIENDNLMNWWQSCIVRSKQIVNKSSTNVENLIVNDLRQVRAVATSEILAVDEQHQMDEQKIGRRLLFLFQKDLLPGINGQILESKQLRDESKEYEVSLKLKIFVWIIVTTMIGGMLFYVYLFSIQQNEQKQKAWLHSFIVWLIFEVLFVSTAVVYITHFLIPSFIMKDLNKIKLKLLETVQKYKLSLENDVNVNVNGTSAFNAAEYTFVSTRVAMKYPNLKESNIILRYSTPWPKQSYGRSLSISKSYSKKFSFISSTISMILIYLIQGFVNVPPVVQDTLIQLISTSGLGYGGVMLLNLYRIQPALPFAILFVIAIAIYLYLISGTKKYANLAEISPMPQYSKPMESSESKNDQETSSSNVLPYLDTTLLHEHADITRMTIIPQSGHVTRRASVQAGIAVVHELRKLHNNDTKDHPPTQSPLPSGGLSKDSNVEEAHFDDDPKDSSCDSAQMLELMKSFFDVDPNLDIDSSNEHDSDYGDESSEVQDDNRFSACEYNISSESDMEDINESGESEESCTEVRSAKSCTQI